MRKGDLVVVLPRNMGPRALGQVVEYRPDTLGGSAVESWRGSDKQWHSRVASFKIRGEVLILTYDNGGISWYDEQEVLVLSDGPHGEGDP